MNEWMERLRAYGADIPGAMARFVDDAELYESCLNMFFDAPEFAKLSRAIAEKDYQRAFDAAHSLKGVCANLGLTPLHGSICEIVEALRVHRVDRLDEQYAAIEAGLSEVKKLL